MKAFIKIIDTVKISAIWRERFSLLALLCLASLLFTRQIWNRNIGYPDADRILMDGVLIRDFLLELPLRGLPDFVESYYAQYPALSIGYRPPFFPFIEALFNLVFGLNMWSSRLAVLAFVLVGLFAWFQLLKRIYDLQIAFWSSCLLITTPFVVQWGYYTMSEIPVLSMVLLTLYVFYRFCETDQPGYLYATAILFSLSMWTKQTAVFLSLCFLLYLLISGQLFKLLKRRSTWIAIVICIVLMMPLVIITIWLGAYNIAHSIGTPFSNEVPKYHWANLKTYIVALYDSQLTLPLLMCSIIGFLISLVQKDKRVTLFICLIVSTYVFFTSLNDPKMPRYTIFWIPAFTLFAVLPIMYVHHIKVVRVAGIAVLACIVLYQLTQVYAKSPQYATGYDTAAQAILCDRKRPMIFVDAYNNGYFIYFMRIFDPKRSVYVLRGDKLLSSSAIGPHTWLKIHAHTEDDIRKIFDKYGVTQIVVESDDYTGLPIHKLLRTFLDSEEFELVEEIPITSNLKFLNGQTLKIYNYLNSKPGTEEFIELELPLVGKTLKVRLKKINE